MTAASEKISEERLCELIRHHKERAIHFEQSSDNGRLVETLKAADPEWEAHDLYRELLQLRAEHEKAELLINDLRRMDLEGGKGSECHEVLRRAIAYLTAQGAARGKG